MLFGSFIVVAKCSHQRHETYTVYVW